MILSNKLIPSIRLCIIGCLLALCSVSLRGQSFRWGVKVGASWQGAFTTNLTNPSMIIPTYAPPLCAGGPCIPYIYERNIQGVGLTASPFVRLGRNWQLEYMLMVRYDEIGYDLYNSQIRYNSVILNHRLGINWLFRDKKQKVKQYLGVAYTIWNTGGKLDFYDNIREMDATLQLQFPSWVLVYGRRIHKDLSAEFNLNWLHQGTPNNPYGNYFMYGLRVDYSFEFKKNQPDK